jgi:hypothetical protein
MAEEVSEGADEVRAAEVIGALCLATNLGMGFPFEHRLHTMLIAMRLADRLDVEPATAAETYYACLLSHSGCTTDAHVTAEIFGGVLTRHFNHRRSGGNPADDPSGGEPPDGTRTSVPVPGSKARPHVSAHRRHLRRTGAVRCPITSPSAKISTRSGSMSQILTTRRRDARRVEGDGP